MRSGFFLLGIVLLCSVFNQAYSGIIITEKSIGSSRGESVDFFWDVNEEYPSVDEILEMDSSKFIRGTKSIFDFGFVNGTYWLRFSVTNRTSNTEFLIETARTITNEVRFYEMDDKGKVVYEFVSGDDYSYDDKEIIHRKNLFPFVLAEGDTKQFYIKLRSDGELLFAPLRINTPLGFYEQDFKDQFKNGFYYGLIILTVVIYFFFFVYLKDQTFLFYILYVFSQGLLQFSLDGYSHHHFFPSGGYLTNHSLLFIAGVAVMFLLIYVSNFLSLKKINKFLYNVFKGCIVMMGIVTMFSLIPGKMYELSYPLINGASLFSILLAAFSILYLRFKGVKVDFFFATAFIILIVGGVVFILGNIGVLGDKEVSMGALKISSALEFVVLSISMSNKYGKLQREKEVAQKQAVKSLRERNELMDESNVRLEQQVKERTQEIERQKEELTISNDAIVSSIKYAKRIQQAILPSDLQVKTLLPESFIFYRPKDVVSGDFYFFESIRESQFGETNFILFAAVDCTGHGVPGAFMSIVGNNYLTQSLLEKNISSPAQVLDFLNQGVSKTLKQSVVDGSAVRDGMDIALCAISEDRSKLLFAGAKNPLYVIRDKANLYLDGLPEAATVCMETNVAVLIEVKGDKFPIGNVTGVGLNSFTDHELELFKDDHIVVFTDGFADQFGGPKHKKFNYSRFKKLLIDNYEEPLGVQEELIREAFYSWKGSEEQIDDVLFIMVKV